MIRRIKGLTPYYEFEIFQPFSPMLRHAVLTRATPLPHAAAVQEALQTKASARQFRHQMHSAKTWTVSEKKEERDGDILMTQIRDIPLVIRVADCASVLFFDSEKRAIANAHAGWRGLAQRVLEKTASRMRERFGTSSRNLQAAISPMLGPCCSRFSAPEKELPRFLHRFISEENTVDLWAAAEAQLKESGIPRAQIENPRICTACHVEEFFSRRREGASTGRFGTAIMLRQ